MKKLIILLVLGLCLASCSLDEYIVYDYQTRPPVIVTPYPSYWTYPYPYPQHYRYPYYRPKPPMRPIHYPNTPMPPKPNVTPNPSRPNPSRSNPAPSNTNRTPNNTHYGHR